MKRSRLTSIMLAASLCSASWLLLPQARANIIDSTYGIGAGSFELGNFPSGVSAAVSLPPGDTSITGWTVGGPGDGVDWLTAPRFAVDTGVHAVDLQHLTNSSLSTVIPTVAGTVYELSFRAAAVTGLTTDGVVSAGSLSNQTFSAPLSSDFATQTYASFAFQFTAAGAATQIVFQAAGPITALCVAGSACYGPAIDSVSVDAAVVPEPDSRLFIAAALAGMLGYAARRSARNAASE